MANEKNPMDNFGEKWKEFVDHVNTHPHDKVIAAVNIVVNKNKVADNGDMSVHICNMFGGSPEDLARAFAEGIDTCAAKIPGFKQAFSQALLMKAIENTINHAIKEKPAKEDEKPADPAAIAKSEAAAKEFLEKLQLPPSGGIH